MLVVAHCASAIPVVDLYVAEVLVTDESQRQLDRGARAGLLQVLIRVSGTPDVQSSSLIAGSLRNPSAYYYQYGYESTDRTLIIDGEPTPARVLKIHFDPSAIARLLRQASYPVWGSNRPSILLWVALSDEKGRRIIGETDDSEFVAQLRDQARLRGLPLLFPLLDLEDSAAIETAEIWGAFLGRIGDASVRYGPDSVLTGRIQVDTQDRWTANWAYRIDDKWQVMEEMMQDRDDMIRVIVDQLANQLAERYALDSSTGMITLQVDSIDSLEDYAGISDYLASLTPVLDSVAVKVEGDQVTFRLSIEGQPQQLVETIALDEKLSLMRNAGSSLYYQWLP